VLKRSILAASIVVGLLASPAFAAVAPHGRGPKAQAAMIARTAGSSKQPVQVLNQLCENPTRQRRCAPIGPSLRRALEHAIDAPITWVGHRRHGLGQYWVLGTVRFDRSPVTTTVAWRDAGRDGCNGWTRWSWERVHGAWSALQGISAVGCSAVPVD